MVPFESGLFVMSVVTGFSRTSIVSASALAVSVSGCVIVSLLLFIMYLKCGISSVISLDWT